MNSLFIVKVDNLMFVKRSYRYPHSYVDHESRMVVVLWPCILVSFKHVLVFILGDTPNHTPLKYKFWLRQVIKLGTSTLNKHESILFGALLTLIPIFWVTSLCLVFQFVQPKKTKKKNPLFPIFGLVYIKVQYSCDVFAKCHCHIGWDQIEFHVEFHYSKRWIKKLNTYASE